MAVEDGDQPEPPTHSLDSNFDNYDSEPVSPISSSSSQNIFGDEFAEDYAESIIAPSITQQDYQNPFEDPSHIENPSDSNTTLTQSSYLLDPNSVSHQDQTQPESSLLRPLSQRHQSPPQTIQSNRISIRKSSSGGPEPTQANHLQSSNSNQFPFIRNSVAQRTNSTSSLVPPQSPLDVNDGPSHPYAMYPQSLGISRTASLATASSTHESSFRASSTPQRPAHPYALYPQTVFNDSADATSSIPVGFPGHGQQFHRRLGADGEEQDIIGLDGHTEQLPPYTRYPDAAVTKGPNDFGSSLPVIGEAAQSRDNLTETPRPQSDSLSTSSATHVNSNDPSSTSTRLPLNSSNTSTDSSNFSEKNFVKGTWRDKSRRKLCGFIPVWLLFLVTIVIVIIAVICGGVIGGYVVKLKDQYKHQAYTATHIPTVTTSLIDAHLMTHTPTGLPVPTGLWNVRLGQPDTRFSACLNDDQDKAWSCDLPQDRNVTIKIVGTEEKLYLDTIKSSEPHNTSYGTQPFEFPRQKLKLVFDIDNKGFGAAYHFQTFYDKVVVIPEAWVERMASQNAQMNVFNLWSRSNPTKFASMSYPKVEIGDNAWFCRWDETFIEGFIYVSQHTARTNLPSSTTSTVSTSSSSLTYTSIPVTSPTPTPTGPNNVIYITPAPLYVPPSYSSSSSLQDEAYSGWEDQSLWPRSDGQSASPTETTNTPTTSQASTPTPTPSYMPYLVKFEERRLEGLHGPPACTLFKYGEDYKFHLYTHENEQPITFLLDEDDGSNWMSKYRYRVRGRSIQGDTNKRGLYRTNKGYHGDLDDTCYCQWVSYNPNLEEKNSNSKAQTRSSPHN